jgi:PKD repeat protein
MTIAPSTDQRLPRHPASSLARRGMCATALLLVLAACSDRGIVGPMPASTLAHPTAAVVVTPNYSTFDTRAEFSGAGVVDQSNGFEEFTGALNYPQTTPWTTTGVTYTSGLNIVLSPAIGLGVSSNALSTTFGSPLTGQFAPSDAITLFGADLSLVVTAAPVKLVLTTNLAAYTFDDLNVPLAAAGHRFFGVALSTPGEYLTGFRFTGGPASALLLDNVAIGHMGKPNADPDAVAGGPYAGQEGSAVALAFGGSDADADALTFSWDLGDGTTGTGATPPSSHIYQDDGTYAITLTVADGRGGVDTARTVASIANVAPVVASFSVPTTPLALTAGGVTLPISATFSDVGVLDTHTATLDCGDGLIAQSSTPNGTASGTCTFSDPGVYAIQLTVRDDDGAGDTRLASGQVVVYDADAGWVTGGGWIASPAQAYAAVPTATGKLTFGFVARYQSSGTPGGNAEFKLNFGKLNFRSTSLDWLVVTANVAQLQGRGTVNGAGDYGFDVKAVDGASGDAIRIRIWHRLTGVVVYDNQPGESLDSDAVTSLGGGSIQLHQR